MIVLCLFLFPGLVVFTLIRFGPLALFSGLDVLSIFSKHHGVPSFGRAVCYDSLYTFSVPYSWRLNCYSVSRADPATSLREEGKTL